MANKHPRSLSWPISVMLRDTDQIDGRAYLYFFLGQEWKKQKKEENFFMENAAS